MSVSYRKPELIDLNDVGLGAAACAPGSQAGNNCEAGTSPIGNCNDGTQPL